MTDTKTIATLKEAGLPMDMAELTKDAKLGGKLGLQDLAIPFIYCLHKLSPQCDKELPKYIKGAEPGMIYMSVVEKVFDTKKQPLEIVFCHYERMLPEWRPREKGGGFIKQHSVDSDILEKARPNEKGVPTLPNGNNIIETSYNYVLLNDGTTWHQGLMPLKSTGLKVSRLLNSKILKLNIPNTTEPAPRFLYKWNMTTLKDQKEDMVWYNPMFTLGSVVDKELYGKAKAFAEIALKGIISTSETEDGASSAGSSRATPLSGLKDDEIPF